MTATDRAPLTKDRIIDAAIAFTDEHGLDALSMRKLGAELGVEAMSLYNHVANKGDIHEGMVDHVFESIPFPDEDTTWQESMRTLGVVGLDVFIEHPWVVTLLMAHGSFGPASLRFTDRVLGILLDSGFTDEDAHHAWQMLAAHTTGYASRGIADPIGMHKGHEVQAALAASGEHFPNVARLAPLLAACDYQSEYAYGLEIVIDGLEARLRTYA